MEITDRDIPGADPHHSTGLPQESPGASFLVSHPVGFPLTEHQVGTPDSTFGLPLPEYFSPEPSPGDGLGLRGASMAIGGPAGPAFSHSRTGLGMGPSMGFGLSSDEPDQESQVMTRGGGWEPFHWDTEDRYGSGGGGYVGGTYSHELA